MTVCIAAFASWDGGDQTIIGASDRMITASGGEIEYEPPTLKIFKITETIVVMIAGEMTIQLEIVEELKRQDFRGKLIKDVANKVADIYLSIKGKMAERLYLADFNLDIDQFNKQQATLNREIVADLYSKIKNFRIPSIETLVVGWDEEGPHIYVVKNANVANYDHIGFASIGIGEHHANSQMMLANYSAKVEVEKAVPLIYIAKKRSEVAAGVGKETDMFILSRGTYTPIDHGQLLAKLNSTFNELAAKEQEIFDASLVDVKTFITKEVYKPEPELPLGDKKTETLKTSEENS